VSELPLIQLGLLQYTLNQPIDTERFSFTLNNGTTVSMLDAGVLLFEPQVEGQRALVFSAGIHGNETAPIECLDKLVSGLLRQTISVSQPLLVILGNPPAMLKACRELEVNLNRLFVGQYRNYPDCYETQRAARLEQVVAEFYAKYPQHQAYHLDLHTAIRASQHEKFAVYPFTHGEPWKLNDLALLQACGVNCVLFSNQPASTFSYHSSFKHNATAFTVELGKVHPFGENDLTTLSQLTETLQQLIGDSDLSSLSFVFEDALLFEVSDVIHRTEQDFGFSFSQSQANFTEYPSGYILGHNGSQQLIVEDGPKAIVFPNDKVALQQRAVLLVKKMSKADIEQAIEQGSLS